MAGGVLGGFLEADVQGKVMIPSQPFSTFLGSGPFGVSTHYLQDLSTKSIPLSHIFSSVSLGYLDSTLFALSFWPSSHTSDMLCQIKRKISTKRFFISPNRYFYHPFRAYIMVQLSITLYTSSLTHFSCARKYPRNLKMSFTQPNTSPIIEISPSQSPSSHAIKSQNCS